MCMTDIRQYVAKKDMTVWKLVLVQDGKEYAGIVHHFWMKDLNWKSRDIKLNVSKMRYQELAPGVSNAIRKNIVKQRLDNGFNSCMENLLSYPIGFSCCRLQRTPKFYIGIRHLNSQVLKYVIPKGVTFYTGQGLGGELFIAPILINPRGSA